MTLSVEVVPVPVLGEPPSPLVAAFAEVSRASIEGIFGDDDLADSAEAVEVAYSEQVTRRKVMVLARDGGAVLGGAYFGMPLRDNVTLAEGDFAVAPGAEVAQVVPALWDAVRDVLLAQGRTTAQVWMSHPFSDDAEQLVPRTGVGSLPHGPLASVLLDLGFTLEQVERHSVLDVVASHERAVAHGELARAAAGTAYEVVGWSGPVPPDQQAAMAQIMARMSTDVPSGDLELEPEVWDAARVAESDRVATRMGRARLTTIARHVPTGEIVAYTVIESPSDKPQAAYQEDTLVHAEHRGHRLGMLVKAGNLEQLGRELPAVRRIHTWNAGENEHMLAINRALGFTDRTVEGGWQLTGL